MKTWFPNCSRPHLERTALDHAIELAVASGRGVETSATDRLVVNMLRHEFTDYDDDPSVANFSSACRAIARRFSWLGQQCTRQVAQRRRAEVEKSALLEMHEEEKGCRREDRRRRSLASIPVIEGLVIGTPVTAVVRGFPRQGTITWRGRRRVEITFLLKSGEVRTSRRYASAVRPVADHPAPR
jgi:hypothetical protein